MININKVNTVYLACGATNLRRSIDGLSLIVQTELKLDTFENLLFGRQQYFLKLDFWRLIIGKSLMNNMEDCSIILS